MELLLSELKCIWVCMQISHQNRNVDWACLRHNDKVVSLPFVAFYSSDLGIFSELLPLFFLQPTLWPSVTSVRYQNCPIWEPLRTLPYATHLLLILCYPHPNHCLRPLFISGNCLNDFFFKVLTHSQALILMNRLYIFWNYLLLLLCSLNRLWVPMMQTAMALVWWEWQKRAVVNQAWACTQKVKQLDKTE